MDLSGNSTTQEREIEERQFKQFDIVTDDSDHYYAQSNRSSKGGHSFGVSNVTKKIMQEWKILEKDLPESIYVRTYEGRIDLLRAVIIGVAGTPYHDGLFFFDFCFPNDYPTRPPEVHYHAYGLRVNPNLYANGRVCLSLLNTWLGDKNEKWKPSESTILQVLLSLQALVLNEKPYFNEPGNGVWPNWASWEKKSLAYNEDAFVLSCKTMLFVLCRPPKHFEDFVAGHFRGRAQAILIACKSYMNSCVKVGHVEGNGSSSSSTDTTVSNKFKTSMGQLYPNLVTVFTKTGASLGNFIEHLKVDNEHTLSRPQVVVNRKNGFTKKAFKKLKKILGLKKVGSTAHETKQHNS